MRRRNRLAAAVLVVAAAQAAFAGSAKEVLEATGVRGGLVVVIGCGEPALLTGLRASHAYLVHGLDT
ncbi:MAG: hypothetical protein ACODAJ_01610, partial [Planctomycetota bacterium]